MEVGLFGGGPGGREEGRKSEGQGKGRVGGGEVCSFDGEGRFEGRVMKN